MASDTPLPPIPPNIAMYTGPTMIGICLNWGLMGVLVVQVYFYHLHFPNDGKWTKSLVYGLILLDVLQTCMITADAFHWFVYGFGNMIQLDDTFLNSWDVCLLDAVISLIVQAFYCYRIWVLRARSYIWPTLIMIVSVTQAVAGIVTAVNAYKLHKLSLIHTEVIEQTTWLVGSALADVLITAVIGWTLLKKRNNELQSSKKMLVRLVRLTVETNALTASVAVIGLIFFLALSQHATLVVPPTAIMGKLYTNCFIAVLNNRAIVKEAGSRYNTNTSGLQSFRMNEPAERPGVHVHVLRDVKADSDSGRDGKEVAIEMERI